MSLNKSGRQDHWLDRIGAADDDADRSGSWFAPNKVVKRQILSSITWRSVKWRGGDGYSGFHRGEMICMIFPATEDRNLPSPFGMFFFSELYDAEACQTGRHVAIPISSLDEGQRIANQILMDGLNRSQTHNGE